MGLKPSSVSSACRALRATSYLPSYDLFTPIVRPENRMWVFFNTKTIHKHFFRNEAVSSNPDTIIDLESRSPLLLGLGGSVSLLVLSYLKWVVCSLPSKAWVSFEKLFLVEYLSFRDEGIQTILLLGYRFSVWFTYCFCWCYHGNIVNPARVLS